MERVSGFRGCAARMPRIQLAVAAILTAIAVSACSGSPDSNQARTGIPTPTPLSQNEVQSASAATALVASVAAKLAAGSVDCTGFKVTGQDPSAIAQGTCGFPNTIEIAAFPSHEAVTQIFAPFLASNCPSLTTIYVDGGLYAVYSVDDATTEQIASTLKLSPSKLC